VISVAQDGEDIDPRSFGIQNFQVLGRYFNSVDRIINPTVTVDPNPVSFTDPETGQIQLDPFTGSPVYVAWNTITNTPAPIGGADINGVGLGNYPFNPNSIKIVGSHDGGRMFTTEQFISDGFHYDGNTVRYALPQTTSPRPPWKPSDLHFHGAGHHQRPATNSQVLNIPPSTFTQDRVLADINVTVNITHPASNHLQLTPDLAARQAGPARRSERRRRQLHQHRLRRCGRQLNHHGRVPVHRHVPSRRAALGVQRRAHRRQLAAGVVRYPRGRQRHGE
jgi:hypothetical protein